ncbi:MAG: hypothetical protein J7L15_04070, partial [Clostridiales bacterium]|nr:hypothetical protein [Clostridiales bacterium]
MIDTFSVGLTEENLTFSGNENISRNLTIPKNANVISATINLSEYFPLLNIPTSGTKHEFDTVYGQDNSLSQIDSTHYLNAYSGADNDGYAVVLTVNQTDWTITSGTKHEFDIADGPYNSLSQIDSTHYLNAYFGGYAVVLTVNQTDWTITSGTKHQFGITQGNSLSQIDSTHYLNAYTDASFEGSAVVLTVNQTDWTITSGTK